ncbi:hypothetical protein B4U37_18155 [Sutcliffiella horikoshii]|uniref:Integrase catalytic domain-containing protein n=1 Tax=Sutcliffiella horikoshii TaxID=79883 RepID=A0ABN4ZIU5_9BACI|nr:hypothetical protein B4U37_02500 [Sutcliffiella horikoshii]ART75716.1 hypothetical protein B4U37_06605 [Sutcliffiella horikoshii]ART76965.1 hypothetical protein B4U37_13330 [Sutcliffiella horikoshii]ART77835.1 hypothetical protein B4U37_18155 [Sutcliffiella horikoshii]
MMMCRALGVTTSGYYLYVKRLEREETEREQWRRQLDDRIRFHFYDNLETYGSVRIHQKLVDYDDFNVSASTVAKRMKVLGLYATPPKSFIATTDSDHSNRTFKNNLKQAFNPEAPNMVWVTDITYISTMEGFIYFNPILDLFGRKVISYSMCDRMDRSLPLRALKEAIKLREPKKGWIHHSDRGSQYCSKDYIDVLEDAKAKISMSRKATPYDNACAESFFASMKKEYLNKFRFTTKAEAMAAVQFYVEFYNRKRIHSTLEYATPNEYEMAYEMAQQKDANLGRKTSA